MNNQKYGSYYPPELDENLQEVKQKPISENFAKMPANPLEKIASLVGGKEPQDLLSSIMSKVPSKEEKKFAPPTYEEL